MEKKTLLLISIKCSTLKWKKNKKYFQKFKVFYHCVLFAQALFLPLLTNHNGQKKHNLNFIAQCMYEYVHFYVDGQGLLFINGIYGIETFNI